MIKKVLVVDDDPNCLMVLSHIVREEGFEVLKASSGEEALEIIDGSFYALITDMNMVKINGNDVAEAVIKRGLLDVKRILLHAPLEIIPQEDFFNGGIFHKPLANGEFERFRAALA